MAELKEVKLSSLEPNPFRDIENYPFWRDKLDRLKESMTSTGAWPGGLIVRANGAKYQLAFGHHRLEAAKELGLKTLEVVVEQLSDDAMLRMMADENAEEFGTNFMLGTMNAVSAVLKAAKAGLVKLECAADHVDAHRISANEVGRYLGWTTSDKTAKGGLQASQRVWTAFNALELIEMGVCKASAFQGLGHEQARAVVAQAQTVYKARMRELDKAAEEKEVKAAKAEAKKASSLAVTKSVNAIRDGAGVRELREETRALKLAPVATQKKADPLTVDISKMMEKASGELRHLAEKVLSFDEGSHNMLKLFGAGAICDAGVMKGFSKSLSALRTAVDTIDDKYWKVTQRRVG